MSIVSPKVLLTLSQFEQLLDASDGIRRTCEALVQDAPESVLCRTIESLSRQVSELLEAAAFDA